VTHVLSILDPDWPVPDAFGSFGEHERLELRFHDVIEETPGMLAPTQENVAQVLAFGRDMLGEPAPGAHLLVHCHAGVSRSTASMILIVAQARPAITGRRGRAGDFPHPPEGVAEPAHHRDGRRHARPRREPGYGGERGLSGAA